MIDHKRRNRRALGSLGAMLFWLAALLGTAVDATVTVAELNALHWWLRASEALYTSFNLMDDADVPWVETNSANTLCMTAYGGENAKTSQRKFSDAWIRVMKGTNLYAVYNGTCFSKAIGECVTFEQCKDSQLEYPEVEGDDGLSEFRPDEDALETLWFVQSAAKVEAWQLEQQQLLAQLAEVSDSDAKVARYIREAIEISVCSVAPYLRSDSDSVAAITYARSLTLAELSTVTRSSSLTTLSSAIDSLMDKTLEDCGSTSITSLRNKVVSAMIGLADVVELIASSMETVFGLADDSDTVIAQLETVLVGVALGLQASLLSVMAQFQCALSTSPSSATLGTFSDVISAATGVLADLLGEMPAVASSDASLDTAPIQSCWHNRMSLILENLDGSLVAVKEPRFLSIDVCLNLRSTILYRIADLAPVSTTGLTWSTTEWESASGSISNVGYHPDGFSLVNPFASVEARSTSDVDLTAFAAGDAVIRLKDNGIDELLRPVAELVPDFFNCPVPFTPPWDWCRSEEMTVARECMEVWCHPAIGNWICGTAPTGFPGRYTGPHWFHDNMGGTDCEYPFDYGEELENAECYTDYFECSPSLFQWQQNASCPRKCEAEDWWWEGYAFYKCDYGQYIKPCNGVIHQCNTSDGIAYDQWLAVVNFTSTGQGKDGCGIGMAFPLGHQTIRVGLLEAPFTVELFVKVDPESIPSAGDELGIRLAILAGGFPRWYIALRRASSTTTRICLYHENITRTTYSKLGSLACSDAMTWDAEWHHIAVVAQNTAVKLDFFRDAQLISTTKRSSIRASMPDVHINQLDALHIGPPNPQLYSSIMAENVYSPYFLVSTEFTFEAQIDEVRVHDVALAGLGQGYFQTDLRVKASCDVPFETLDGDCRVFNALTEEHSNEDQDECESGYEVCSASSGLCVAECPTGTTRQADCSCDCSFGYYQVWQIKVVEVLGQGSILNVTVYGSKLQVIATSDGGTNSVYLSFSSLINVAAVAVRAGGSATTISLRVTGSEGTYFVPEHTNVALTGTDDVVFHHRRTSYYEDTTLACAACAGEGSGSVQPRTSVLSCRCWTGYYPNDLGKCVEMVGSLDGPIISPANGQYASPGTPIKIQAPAMTIVDPHLLELRYTVGLDGSVPAAPGCDDSSWVLAKSTATCTRSKITGSSYSGTIQSSIYRGELTTVKAIACHKMYESTIVTVAAITGSPQMNVPLCTASGTFTTSDNTSYAELVAVTLSPQNDPEAYVMYTLSEGGVYKQYQEPIQITTPGTTIVYAKTRKTNADDSLVQQCAYTVDGAARLAVEYTWIAILGSDGSGDTFIGAYIVDQDAYMVKPEATQLHLSLTVVLADDSSSAADIDYSLQYRLKLGSSSFQAWTEVQTNGSVTFDPSSMYKTSGSTIKAQIQWRVKEDGYAYSATKGVNVLLLATKSPTPTYSAVLATESEMTDHWFQGAAREVALTQEHTVTLSPATSRLLFSFGTDLGEAKQLVTAQDSGQSFASMSSSVIWDFKFTVVSTSSFMTLEEYEESCTGLGILSQEPILCEYQKAFPARGGSIIQMIALQGGNLPSKVVDVLIPVELEPEDSEEFQATVVTTAIHSEVTALPKDMVLPSTASTIAFTAYASVTVAIVRYCILISGWTFKTVGKGKALSECTTWTQASGTVSKSLSAAITAAGISDESSANFTVLTTVCKSGYLCAYPTRKSFLLIRELTPTPSAAAVTDQSGSCSSGAACLAGMVWLDWFSGYATEEVRLFFTFTADSDLSDLQDYYLVKVPSASLTLATLEDAAAGTSIVDDSVDIDVWQTTPGECIWPAFCELELDTEDGAAHEVVRPPSDPKVMCVVAWAAGRMASEPRCATLEGTGTDGELSVTIDEESSQVVTDATFGATLVVPFSSSATLRRLSSFSSSEVAYTLPFALSSTLMARFRHAVTTASVSDFSGGVASLFTSSTKFSEWAEWETTLTFSGLQTDEHILVAADFSFLAFKEKGVQTWSDVARQYFVTMVGAENEPTITFDASSRKVIFSGLSAATKILYRWVKTSGTGLSQLTVAAADATTWDTVWKLNVTTSSKTSDCSRNGDGDGEVEPDPLVFCLKGPVGTTNSSVQVYPPNTAEWILQAAAYQPGLTSSVIVEYSINSQCQVVSSSSYTALKGCTAGVYLNEGDSCTPACEEGYAPSVSSVSCDLETSQEVLYDCGEAACILPEVQNVLTNSSCALYSVSSGSVCIPDCDGSLVPSASVLSCDRGVLSPSTWECQEASSDWMVLPLWQLASIGGGGMLVLAFLATACAIRCCFRQPQAEHYPMPDALEEWWLCVQEVQDGTCVFCGKNKAAVTLTEASHGPPTTFRCCKECGEIIKPLMKKEELLNKGSSTAAAAAAAAVLAGAGASKSHSSGTLLDPPLIKPAHLESQQGKEDLADEESEQCLRGENELDKSHSNSRLEQATKAATRETCAAGAICGSKLLGGQPF